MTTRTYEARTKRPWKLEVREDGFYRVTHRGEAPGEWTEHTEGTRKSHDDLIALGILKEVR